MKYGLILTVFAMSLLSATLVHSVEAFRPSGTQAPTDTTTSTTQVPSPGGTQAPTDTTTSTTQVPSPGGTRLTVMGSSTYTDDEGHFNIIGEVRNNSNQTFKFVRVSANVYDPSQRIIDTSSAFTSLEELRPQETSNFHIIFPNQQTIDQSDTYIITVTPSQTATPKPQLLQMSYGNVRSDSPDAFTFVGEVTNQGNQPVDLVKVSGSFYDTNNQLVDVQNVYAQPSTLQPGQSGSFEITASKSSNPSIANIASASFDVESSQYSSASMGQKVFVPATLNGDTAAPTTGATTAASQSGVILLPPGFGLHCGKGTHINDRGNACIADHNNNNNNNNGNNKNNNGNNKNNNITKTT